MPVRWRLPGWCTLSIVCPPLILTSGDIRESTSCPTRYTGQKMEFKVTFRTRCQGPFKCPSSSSWKLHVKCTSDKSPLQPTLHLSTSPATAAGFGTRILPIASAWLIAQAWSPRTSLNAFLITTGTPVVLALPHNVFPGAKSSVSSSIPFSNHISIWIYD